MIGAGPYDELATAARHSTNADAVVLLVCGGTLGSGFSVQLMSQPDPLQRSAMLEAVARALQQAVDQIQAHASELVKGKWTP